MNGITIFKRCSFCALALCLGIASVSLLLNVITPAQATPLEKYEPQEAITGTITIWHSYGPDTSEELALDQVIADVLSENPDLVITATHKPFGDISALYEAAVLSGGGPDLLLSTNDNLGHEFRMGVISNLDDYLEGRLTKVYTTAIEGMKVNGELFGVPESAKAVALFYNKAAVSTPPVKTTDLLQLVQQGKKLVIANGLAGGPYYNFGFYGAFDGKLLDENGRCIAKDGGVAPAMQYLVDLKNAGATIITDSYGQGNAPFCNRQIDMLIDGPWNLRWYQECLGDDLGLVLLPEGPDSAASPMNGIDGFFVNPNTDHFTSTIELALFMTNQPSAQIFTNVGGHVPTRTDVSSTDPLVNTFALASAQGWPRYQGPEMDNYWLPFGDMMTWVLAGVVSPEQGVRIACDRMNLYNGFGLATFVPFISRK
jgi:arabinogalactan oligomer / maltooligosaccharide transport system substrate-binding protein